MGYMHIENLYRPIAQSILLFREVYALEKVHGTSAHIAWRTVDGNTQLSFFAGGESHANFVALFDAAALTQTFTALGHPDVFQAARPVVAHRPRLTTTHLLQR